MEKGIQLNVKTGDVLINVYEPEMSNGLDAVALIKTLSDAISETFGYVGTKNEEKSIKPQNAGVQEEQTGAVMGFCKECGAPKKWIKFKEPRENKFRPGEMQEGFWGCSANCKSKA